MIQDEWDNNQYNTFVKKYNRDFFTALCIKTGRMESGSIFCREGEKYKYIIVEVKEDDGWFIRMKSKGDKGYTHSMNWNFFFKYYIRDEGDFIKAKEMEL